MENQEQQNVPVETAKQVFSMDQEALLYIRSNLPKIVDLIENYNGRFRQFKAIFKSIMEVPFVEHEPKFENKIDKELYDIALGIINAKLILSYAGVREAENQQTKENENVKES